MAFSSSDEFEAVSKVKINFKLIKAFYGVFSENAPWNHTLKLVVGYRNFLEVTKIFKIVRFFPKISSRIH